IDIRPYITGTGVSNLSLMKAGRFDSAYHQKVNSFDWEGLYNRIPGIFVTFAEHLSERFDYILIDSRTGETDISGICTRLLPSALVVVFVPNHQSINGILDVVSKATTYRRQSDDLRPLVVFPLVSRV